MSEKRAWPRTKKELWLFIRVLGLLTAMRLMTSFVNLKRLLKWLSPSHIPVTADRYLLEKAARYIDAILLRIPFPSRGKCLPRCLTLYYFAARYGYPVRVNCGVRRVEGTLQGHAWLSLNGKPFLEEGSPGRTYAVTFSFPDSETA